MKLVKFNIYVYKVINAPKDFNSNEIDFEDVELESNKL